MCLEGDTGPTLSMEEWVEGLNLSGGDKPDLLSDSRVCMMLSMLPCLDILSESWSHLARGCCPIRCLIP